MPFCLNTQSEQGLKVDQLTASCVLQVHRCRQSISFSLQCAWLLGAYSSDMHISTQRHSRGTKLRKLILSDELKPAGPRVRRDPLALTPFCPAALPTVSPGPLGGDHSLSPTKRTHQRSKSDATVSISLSSNLKRTASNPKVETSQDEVTARPWRVQLTHQGSFPRTPWLPITRRSWWFFIYQPAFTGFLIRF